MNDIILFAILGVLILIWIQDNRIGREISELFNRIIYKWRTRKLK